MTGWLPPPTRGYRCEVFRSGRRRWAIWITNGGGSLIGDPFWGLPTARSRRRAERKARRILAKLTRRDSYLSERFSVPVPRPEGAPRGTCATPPEDSP